MYSELVFKAKGMNDSHILRVRAIAKELKWISPPSK
jgi:hypothetical protein